MTSEISFDYVSELDQLEDIATKAVNLGTNLGASQVEAVVTNGFNRSLAFKNNLPSGIQQQSTSGIFIRSYIGNKLGISSSSSLSLHTVEDSVKSSFDLAKLSPADDDFKSLPNLITRKPKKIKNLYDNDLANFDPEDLIELSNDMISGATDVHDKLISSGQLRINTTELVIANSLGVEIATKRTNFTVFTSSSIPLDLTNIGTGSEFFVARTLKDKIDPFEVGRISGEKAVKMLNGKSGPTGTFPIVIDQRATNQSIRSLVGSGVNAFSVMMNTSYFADKIGEEIAVENLNVRDHPHVSGGMGSRSFDAEGVPTMKVEVIKNGILSSYLTDSYTSNKLGIENTGSASGGRGNVPRPGTSQFHIDAGTDSFSAMVEDMKEGIYLESVVGGMFNRGSPNISNKIDRGFYVKNGEIQYALKNSMLGTNVFEFLKNISAISKELRIEFGSQSPAISVENISIGGAGDQKTERQSNVNLGQ